MVNKEVSTDSILKGDKEVDLSGAILVANTYRDGFTQTHEGRYLYQVKEDKGALKVYPVIEGQDPSKPLEIVGNHIIEATEDKIVIVPGATYDPSNELGESQAHTVLTNDGINAGVITAFNEYVNAKFRLGIYNNFVEGDTTVILPESEEPETPEEPGKKPETPEEPKDESETKE